MSKRTRSIILRYGIVPIAVAVALVLRHVVASLVGAEFYFLFLWPAVIFCAWYGGFGPGLFATVLSAFAANFFYLEPTYSLGISNLTELIVMTLFVTLGCLVSLLCELLHRTRRDLEERSLEVARQATGLKVILASIADAVLATEAQGRISFLNGAAETLTGWSERDAAGRPYQEVLRVISEVPLKAVENPVAAVLRTLAVVRLSDQVVLVSREGTARSIQGSAAPLRDDKGNLLGVVLAFQDVTERRRGDEARSQLAAIVESCDDAIVSRTLDGIVTTWNAGAERLYGYTAEEMIGKPISVLVPRHQAAELPEFMEKLRRGERIEPYETVRVRKDGVLIEVSVSVAPVKNEAGRVVGAAIIARRLAPAPSGLAVGQE
jgi:PAS domain S-box-containing protein